VADEDGVIERLRAFGSLPVPEHLRRRHLSLLTGVSGARPAPRPLPRRRVLAAAIAALALAVAAAGALLSTGGPERRPLFVDDGTTTETSEPSETSETSETSPATTEDGNDDDGPPGSGACDDGRPPFAGQNPGPRGNEGRRTPGADRQGRSDAHEEAKAACATSTSQGPIPAPAP
jgi:hypothetical protein